MEHILSTSAFMSQSSSGSYVYFKVKSELLPISLHGTAAQLPLFLEYPAFREGAIDPVRANKFFMYYFEEFTAEQLRAILGAKHTAITVLDTRTELLVTLPRIIKYNKWNVSSGSPNNALVKPTSPEILDEVSMYYPHITVRSHNLTGNTYNIVLSEAIINLNYTKSDKYYGTPELTQHSFLTHLKTQLYTRYYVQNIDPIDVERGVSRNNNSRVRYSNIVLDSYLPFTVCELNGSLNTQVMTNSISSCKDKFKAISPLTADMLGITQIPLQDILTKVLKLDLDNLKALFKTVKKRKLTINFAGTGGTGINTIVWLKHICDLLGIKQLFAEVNLFEKDYIDLSNIFRFPLPLSTYTSLELAACKKVNLIYPYAQDICRLLYVHDKFLETIDDFPSEQLATPATLHDNIITYGAPSIANRNFLSSVGNFISATHANNTASLYLNPIADETLQVETYGLIQLNSFFINQIRMAIGFIEILAAGIESTSDTLFADYTFTSNHSDYFFNISTEMVAREIGDN